MGIGISYRGVDGKVRNFDFDNLKDASSALESEGIIGTIRSGQGVRMTGRARRDQNAARMQAAVAAAVKDDAPQTPDAATEEGAESGKVRITMLDEPGFFSEKLLKEGSVDADNGHVFLKGDRSRPREDLAIYSVFNGQPLWRTLGELDPASDGVVLGPGPGGSDEPDTTAVPAGRAFTMTFVTRNAALAIPGVTGLVRIYAFYRKIKFSRMGRCLGATAEEPQLLGLFSTVSVGDMAVRAFVKEQNVLAADGTTQTIRILTHLAFGDPNGLLQLSENMSSDPTELTYPPGVQAIVPVNPILDYVDEQKNILIT